MTKHPGGRPSKYDPSFVQKVDEYLTKCKDKKIGMRGLEVKLPKREGFAIFLRVTRQTLDNWSKEHPEFFDALSKIDLEQKERLINSGLSGAYNPTIAKLVLSANHGMADKIEEKQDGTVTVKILRLTRGDKPTA
jgi:hypothetical protein